MARTWMLETTRNLLQCATVPHVEMQRSGLNDYYRTGIVGSGFGMSSGYECMGKMIVEDSFVRQHAHVTALTGPGRMPTVTLQRELARSRNPGRTVPHTVHIHLWSARSGRPTGNSVIPRVFSIGS